MQIVCPSCGAGIAALTDAASARPMATATRNQSTAPPGFDSKRLHIIELGSEIEGLEGRGLRMSRVTVAPGAVFPTHSHRDAPEIIYVVEGVLSEQRNDEPEKGHGPGSVLAMTKEVSHALFNRTATPVIYMSTSIKA